MDVFRNLPVARKFLAAFGLICTLCALLGNIALTGMYKINDSTSNLAEIVLPSAQNLAKMESAMQIYRRADMGILLCDTHECTDYYVKTRERTSQSFETAAAAYLAGHSGSDERAQFELTRDDFTSYRAASDRTVARLTGGQKPLAAEQTVGANAIIFRHADAGMGKALEVNTQSSQRRCLAAAATFKLVRMFVVLMLAFTGLLPHRGLVPARALPVVTARVKIVVDRDRPDPYRRAVRHTVLTERRDVQVIDISDLTQLVFRPCRHSLSSHEMWFQSLTDAA